MKKEYFKHVFIGALLLVCTLFCSGHVAFAQDKPAAPLDQWERQPVLVVPPVKDKAPVIDGHVNFQEWYHAAAVAAFYDPEIGGLGQYPASMYLQYDAEALYVGMTIHRHPMYPTPKSTFPAGPHESIWWKDDNFELVIEPGAFGKDTHYGYAFVGNSVGGYSDLRYEAAAGSDAAWNGKWEYKATRGRDTWSAELKIPFAHFDGVLAPQPGTEWFFDALIQSVTPRKQMYDWAHMWSFGQTNYRSENKARLIFGDRNTPIFRLGQIGQMRSTDKQTEAGVVPIGMRAVFYHQGNEPYALDVEAVLYRADARAEGTLNFMDLWDRLLVARKTGQAITDPKETTQSFRNEASFLEELNKRYQPIKSASTRITVKPDGAGYFPLDHPKAPGDYVVAYRFRDAKTGKLLASQLSPFSISPKFDVALTPYFLQHQKLRLDIRMDEVSPDAAQIRAQLKIGDRVLAEERLPLGSDNRSEARLYLSTRDWPEQAGAQIEAELLDNASKVLESSHQTLQRPASPSWWNQKIGLSSIVPPPFTPVQSASQNEVSVWGRRYRFGENGLPSSIHTRGEELLSRPLTLGAEVNGAPLAGRSTLARQSHSEREAIFESVRRSAEIEITTRTTVQYDGAMRFDINLAPQNESVSLNNVVLEIPLKSQWATLFTHNGTHTDFNKNRQEGLSGALDRWFESYPNGAMPFTYAFFLGHYDRGVQWFAPSDRGWSNTDENRKIALVRSGSEVVLRVTFADKAFNLESPLDLNFGLTVTPVKETPARGRDLSIVAYGKPSELREQTLEQFRADFKSARESGGRVVSSYLSDFDDIFGQPWVYSEADRQLLKGIAEAAHEADMKYRPYSGWGVHTNIPEFETFGKEMLKEPARNAGWGVYWMNPRSAAWADWWLAGAKDNAEQLGFDGMYLDGTVMPELTANELDDMGWRDAQGNLRGTYPVWELRDFLRRLYVLFHVEAKTDGVVDVHDGREPLYFINSFADTTVSGEYHLKRGKTILEVFSSEEFAAYYASNFHGVPRRLIWWNWMKLPITENEMRSMALLHDTPMVQGGGRIKLYRTQVGYGRMTDPWVRFRLLRERYADAEFLPYWSTPVIDAAPAGLRASAWVDRKTNRAMIVVANLSTEPWQGNVKLNAQRLNVAPDAAISDAMFDLPLNYQVSESLPLSIEGQSYRLLMVNDRFPVLTPPKMDGTEKLLPIKK